MGLPNWVEKQKKPGVEIHRRGDHYYAYRISSRYNPKTKRSKKVTVEYLGKVTPQGIRPPKHKQAADPGRILEAGNVVLLAKYADHVEGVLADHFPDAAQSLMAAGALKLAYGDPLKRLKFRYDTTWACRQWPAAALSKNSLTRLLANVGRRWGAQRAFFQDISRDEGHMAIDLTSVFNQSRKIHLAETGYNADGVLSEQVKLLLLWGMNTHRPGFLKVLPGSLNDAATLVRASEESGLKDVVFVGDKAFYSRQNVEFLEANHAHYALALKRDFTFLEHPPASRYRNRFQYRGRTQWWREYVWEGRRVLHFLDKHLAAKEESNFYERVDAGKSSEANRERLKHRWGTLAILTDTGLAPAELYGLYKERREIEDTFDALLNTLGGDKSWMQSRQSLQGYYFILFLGLHLHAQILDHLRRKDLTNEYSVQDILWYLSKVQVVEMAKQDRLAEVPKQAARVIEKLELSITQTLGS